MRDGILFANACSHGESTRRQTCSSTRIPRLNWSGLDVTMAKEAQKLVPPLPAMQDAPSQRFTSEEVQAWSSV
jgi:hypothetical protein